MKLIERRVAKLEKDIGQKPLQIIIIGPGQMIKEAVNAYQERYPDVQGLVILIKKKS